MKKKQRTLYDDIKRLSWLPEEAETDLIVKRRHYCRSCRKNSYEMDEESSSSGTLHDILSSSSLVKEKHSVSGYCYEKGKLTLNILIFDVAKDKCKNCTGTTN